MLIDSDFEVQQELQPELIAGEKLLWTGRPKTGIVFRGSDVVGIPFSILWFGFAIFWESSVLSGGPSLFAVFGIPFILMGLYMFIGRFFYDAWLRKSTIYAITNTRIIIRSGVIKSEISSFNIGMIPNLRLEEKTDGSGNIKLEQDKPNFAGTRIVNWPGSEQPKQIELIPNVRNVYNLILQQQHKQ